MKPTPKNNFLKTFLPVIGIFIISLSAWLLLRGLQDNPRPIAKPIAKQTTAH